MAYYSPYPKQHIYIIIIAYTGLPYSEGRISLLLKMAREAGWRSGSGGDACCSNTLTRSLTSTRETSHRKRLYRWIELPLNGNIFPMPLCCLWQPTLAIQKQLLLLGFKSFKRLQVGMELLQCHVWLPKSIASDATNTSKSESFDQAAPLLLCTKALSGDVKCQVGDQENEQHFQLVVEEINPLLYLGIKGLSFIFLLV